MGDPKLIENGCTSTMRQTTCCVSADRDRYTTERGSGKMADHAEDSRSQCNLVGVSKNRGGKTPQIIHLFIGFANINHPFWGVKSPYFWFNTLVEPYLPNCLNTVNSEGDEVSPNVTEDD